LLERHVGKPAILFGHSLGGWVALLVAAQNARWVRALILGDPPLCIARFLEIEGSAQRVEMWRTMRDLASMRLSVPDLAAKLAELSGRDAAHLHGWAKTLSQVDPDVIQYHASGRLDEYVEQMRMDSLLGQVVCPTLLLQGDPQQGARVQDADVAYALSHLRDGLHVRLPDVGHGLGLDSRQVVPLLRAITDFLESLP
jgi:pimeloyl-ACP methyl ester carboxylesterase